MELARLDHVKTLEELSRLLKPAGEEHDADASVALLLKAVDRDLKVLIVKRVENPTDPWSGQMALPGGKRDAKDQNLKQTIIRETLEETNINLLKDCCFLGSMETLRSTLKPEMKILPFIVLLEREIPIKLNEELEGFVWISLEELAQHGGTAKFSFGEFPAYIVGNNVSWGLTYRILEKLLRFLRNSC